MIASCLHQILLAFSIVRRFSHLALFCDEHTNRQHDTDWTCKFLIVVGGEVHVNNADITDVTLHIRGACVDKLW